MSSKAEISEIDKRGWMVIGVLGLVTLWGFGNAIADLLVAWRDAQYSHGWLVPLMAAGLIWLRREPIADNVPSWQRITGLAIIAGAVIIRALAAVTVTMTVDRLMLIPVLIGIFILVGGLRTIRWAGVPLLFLVFMYPLPRFLEDHFLRRLKDYSTTGSLFTLQTMGIESFREGNRIMLDQSSLGVVDACSGLRMTTIFLALGAAIALLSVTRPMWERILVFVSSVPIALAVNVIRITITGLVNHLVGGQNPIADKVSHDFAGLLMMPLAIGMLYLVGRILSRLIIEQETPLPAAAHGFSPKTS